VPRESGRNTTLWPYCQPGLEEFYSDKSKCDDNSKNMASCLVPRAMRVWNGNGNCVNHTVCSGGGYCHEGVQATRAPFI
jgi:hypothetical protein